MAPAPKCPRRWMSALMLQRAATADPLLCHTLHRCLQSPAFAPRAVPACPLKCGRTHFNQSLHALSWRDRLVCDHGAGHVSAKFSTATGALDKLLKLLWQFRDPYHSCSAAPWGVFSGMHYSAGPAGLRACVG